MNFAPLQMNPAERDNIEAMERQLIEDWVFRKTSVWKKTKIFVPWGDSKTHRVSSRDRAKAASAIKV